MASSAAGDSSSGANLASSASQMQSPEVASSPNLPGRRSSGLGAVTNLARAWLGLANPNPNPNPSPNPNPNPNPNSNPNPNPNPTPTPNQVAEPEVQVEAEVQGFEPEMRMTVRMALVS